MENLKIRIHNEEHSKAVQEKLFELGYRWGSLGDCVSYTDRTYLFAIHKYIGYSYCNTDFEMIDSKEVTLDDLYKMTGEDDKLSKTVESLDNAIEKLKEIRESLK